MPEHRLPVAVASLSQLRLQRLQACPEAPALARRQVSRSALAAAPAANAPSSGWPPHARKDPGAYAASRKILLRTHALDDGRSCRAPSPHDPGQARGAGLHPRARQGLPTRLYDPVTTVLGVRSTQAPLVEHADVRRGSRRPGDRLRDGERRAGGQAPAAHRRGARSRTRLRPLLARARRKADRQGLALELARGFAERLPYPDAAFDRVFSAYMFHHLDPEARRETLREVTRVLRPGGSLHLLDFGGARDPSDGRLARRMQRDERLRDNFDGAIPAHMTQAGLLHAREVDHQVRRFGRVTYHSADAPA